MAREYERYDGNAITKELLDSIKTGDLIKINDWKKPLRVRGVSDNYFVMATKQFGNAVYSVCEKKPWGGIRRNAMVGGMFHCGTNPWICVGQIGTDDYDFDDAEQTAAYLQSFETGESELSYRTTVAIYSLQIKRG